MKYLFYTYALGVGACTAFFAISAMPGRGRPWANAHPYIRGGDGTKEGSDRGFNGDMYDD